jgi:broad specificity phosphatase PhoE
MGAIYLIRHGQASFGSSDYDQLSELGHRQAQVLGASLRSRVPQVDHVYCGGMRRHRETAENCLNAMGQNPIWHDDHGWAEYDHVAILAAYQPRWADQVLMKNEVAAMPQSRKFFQEAFAAAVARWVAGEHDQDYPESWDAFCVRVGAALQRLRSAMEKSQTAMVFTSGGPISALAQQLLGIPRERTFRLNWTLANCGVTKLIYSERDLYLGTLNEHSCFEGPHSDLITYR